MEPEAPPAWAYAAALVLTVVCLALANFAVAWLGEMAGVRPGTPAVAALALAQGLVGAVLALFASRQLLRSAGPADVCLKWIVILVAVAFAVVIVWLLATGKSGRAMNWTTYGGVAALVGTEIGRRVGKGLFARPAGRPGALPD